MARAAPRFAFVADRGSRHPWRMGETWSNWSGTVEATPARVLHPDSEDAIARHVAEVARRGGTLRVAGSGHSHPPLCATDDTLLRLDRFAGIESIDRDTGRAVVRGGSVLASIGEPLLDAGLAMQNLGDVDVQALAGALATGTHGTGRQLGGLPTQVVGLRLVDGRGNLRHLDAERDPALFDAARVSLGALGVVTAATLQLVPAYRLHERLLREEVDTCLARFDERADTHRHCEFFWLPSKDQTSVKLLDATDVPPDPLEDRPYERIDHSHRILPSTREDRFVELEFNLPAEVGLEAFREVRALMQRDFPDVVWPVEVRCVAPDTLPLSPATGRPGMTISVHQGVGLPFEPLFRAAERLLEGFGGRPHWGKWHTRTRADLEDRYPQWRAFQEARRALDPDGVFRNAALAALFD